MGNLFAPMAGLMALGCRVEGEARKAADAKQALCDRFQQEAAQNASALAALKTDHFR